MPKLKLATEIECIGDICKAWECSMNRIPLVLNMSSNGSSIMYNCSMKVNKYLLFQLYKHQIFNEPQLIIHTIYSIHSKLFRSSLNGMIMPSIGNFNRIPQTIASSTYRHNQSCSRCVQESFSKLKESIPIYYSRL